MTITTTPWAGALITNRVYKMADQGNAEVQMKVRSSQKSVEISLILIGLGMYAGKKGIDLAFKELERYIEERRKKKKKIKYESRIEETD